MAIHLEAFKRLTKYFAIIIRKNVLIIVADFKIKAKCNRLSHNLAFDRKTLMKHCRIVALRFRFISFILFSYCPFSLLPLILACNLMKPSVGVKNVRIQMVMKVLRCYRKIFENHDSPNTSSKQTLTIAFGLRLEEELE
jgi:hypothetical protein